MERKGLKLGPHPDVLVNFEFLMPPEAPFFEPTKEEFKDPLAYINKIRPIAERSGICRIKPPQHWQPPFAVDIGKFKFTPRVQRLNELEAKTRIRLNFLDQIAKFWELQGTPLKIPMVERKILDLYTLHQIVRNEGGLAVVTKDRLWSKVAMRLGMPKGRATSSILRGHYEKILSPFDIFEETKASKDENDKEDSNGNSNELKRLQIHGAGPKMAGFNVDPEKKSKKGGLDYQDPLAKYICQICMRGDGEESMLLCDGCDDSYHTFCLIPPLTEIPKGDWRCPKCIAKEVSKPKDPFGFEQAQREYTLQQFGEMADLFKANYFNMPVHRVPLPLVEKEFWRIVSSIDEDVTVEYGADLHSIDHGSGFPMKESVNLEIENADIMQYVESPWNLNNMPVLEGSVLSHISANISGMKVPWMYVGMCFATFCWHNEDHWSYSINYLHWGEPKTWYGVPGSYADHFEATMKQVAPELFQTQPDLLHQLTTIMNPNVLMKDGVPVYRTDQQAGEFVITFPRAYHAGFNQGYNFAEAVNFAPADWLPMGRECITRYASLHRYCVFSHDELVCKIALNAESIDPRIAAATYVDMLRMIEVEKVLRKKLLEWGVCEAEREAYELVPDDGRQCEFCKTTCFLSAVTCKCSADKLVCLHHFNSICECSPENHILRYRYTMDELPVMLQKLKLKAESFDVWMKTVRKILNHEMSRSLDLNGLKLLLVEAKDKRFPDSEALHSLTNALHEAEKCSNIAQRLKANRLRVRTRVSNEKRMTVEELTLFIKEVDNLVCKIDEGDSLKSWLHQALHFKKHVSLLHNMDSISLQQLRTALEEGISLNLEFVELDLLSKEIQVRGWIEKVEIILLFDEDAEEDELKAVIVEGVELSQNNNISLKHQNSVKDYISKLQILLRLADKWETKAVHLLNAKTEDRLQIFENHLIDGKYIPVKLCSHNKLANAVALTKAWYKDLENICEENVISNKNELQHLIERAASLPININVDKLKNSLIFRDKWIAEVCKAFLKDGDQDLIEILFPRIINFLQDEKQTSPPSFPLCNIPLIRTEWFNSFYKKATIGELTTLKSLRIQNKKLIMNSKDVSRQCFCKSKKKGAVIKCILCSVLNHEICVSKNWRSKENKSSYLIMNYICPDCERSKRPPLNVIKSLIADLQNTSIKFPEGEALKLLMERIKVYKMKVEKILQNKNLLEEETINNYRKKQKIKDNIEEDLPVYKDNTKYKNCDKNEIDEIKGTLTNNQLMSSKAREEEDSPKTLCPSDSMLKSDLKLTKDDLSIIKSLLHEGSAIEASIIHTSFLLKLLKMSKHASSEKKKANVINTSETKHEKRRIKNSLHGNIRSPDNKQKKTKGRDEKDERWLSSERNYSSKLEAPQSTANLVDKGKLKKHWNNPSANKDFHEESTDDESSDIMPKHFSNLVSKRKYRDKSIHKPKDDRRLGSEKNYSSKVELSQSTNNLVDKGKIKRHWGDQKAHKDLKKDETTDGESSDILTKPLNSPASKLKSRGDKGHLKPKDERRLGSESNSLPVTQSTNSQTDKVKAKRHWSDQKGIKDSKEDECTDDSSDSSGKPSNPLCKSKNKGDKHIKSKDERRLGSENSSSVTQSTNNPADKAKGKRQRSSPKGNKDLKDKCTDDDSSDSSAKQSSKLKSRDTGDHKPKELRLGSEKNNSSKLEVHQSSLGEKGKAKRHWRDHKVKSESSDESSDNLSKQLNPVSKRKYRGDNKGSPKPERNDSPKLEVDKGKAKRHWSESQKDLKEDETSDEESSCDNVSKLLKSPVSKRKSRRVKGPQKAKNSQDEDESSDEEGGGDDDEDCAVPNCLRPVGVKVDWVQCDQCLCWYHMLCIKLRKSDIKEDQDFFCHECKKNSRFPRRCKK